MKIEIVSHCWNYARLLTYQLSSLVLYQPQSCQVQVTVFFTPSDSRTKEVLDFFEGELNQQAVGLNAWPLPQDELMRRAIGRNLAAKATHADWVWFTDCDHTFGQDALDKLAIVAQRESTVDLLWPAIVWKSTSHARGDAAIERVTAPGLYDINPSDFEPVKHRWAIGGLQIVRGSRVREIGYCPGRYGPQQRWRRTVEDPVFLRQIGPGRAIRLPNVYRIRHSLCGRDVSQPLNL